MDAARNMGLRLCADVPGGLLGSVSARLGGIFTGRETSDEVGGVVFQRLAPVLIEVAVHIVTIRGILRLSRQSGNPFWALRCAAGGKPQ